MAAVTFSDVNLDGTYAPGVGAVDPVTSSPTQVDPVIGVLTARARLSLDVPRPAPPALTRTVSMAVSMTMPTPAIHRGKPHIPKLWAKLGITARAISGPDHLTGFDDPDPIWDGSGWVVPPPVPKAGGHLVRWTVRDLPDPITHGGAYLLGTRSTLDGTSGLPAGVDQWDSSGGSDFSIPWQSAYPFKPTVHAHWHYGWDGIVIHERIGVHFTGAAIEHMWADFGTVMTPPFTILVVGVVTDFPRRDSYGFFFDAGSDQRGVLSAGQKLAIFKRRQNAPIKVSESLGYRNALRVGRTQLQAFNDTSPGTRTLRAPYTHKLKPKLFAMVVAGGNSLLYVRDTRQRHVKRQTLAGHGNQRDWLLGRANGVLDEDKASNMVVFEIRAWDSALDADDLDKQYGPLSSTWRFHAYA